MEDVFMDGTFSVAPPLFEQVFVMLVKRGGYVFPVLFAVLRNKQQVTYDRLFGLIKEVWPVWGAGLLNRYDNDAMFHCRPE